MEVVICKNAEEVGRVAADRVALHLEGLATPVPRRLRHGKLAVGAVRGARPAGRPGDPRPLHALGFALDEYVGIDPAHPESYASAINRTVTVPLRMDPERVRVPDGAAADPQAAADEYDAAIEIAGGVDVQILGIGSNGHIGFNELFSSFSLAAHSG